MTKVELFINSSPSGLQNEINSWIARNSDKLIQDIKYSVSGSWHHAMIIYKVLI